MFSNQSVASIWQDFRTKDRNAATVVAVTEKFGPSSKVCFIGKTAEDHQKLVSNVEKAASAYYDTMTSNKGKSISEMIQQAFSDSPAPHSLIEFYVYTPAEYCSGRERFHRIDLGFKYGAYVSTAHSWKPFNEQEIPDEIRLAYIRPPRNHTSLQATTAPQ